MQAVFLLTELTATNRLVGDVTSPLSFIQEHTTMSRILAIDLGKFTSVTCLLDTDTNQTEFWSMTTDRQYLLAVLKRFDPDLVVIESCGLAGWVHDVCTAEGYQVLVCNPNQEAWKWKHIKRKTDRDDALKLAKLAALGQLIPVYIPCRPQREYRRLVKYRQVVLGRVIRVQNNIRSIFAQRGMEMMRGQKAWALERYEEIAQHRKPLAECALDDLWRGELDLELMQLDHLRHHQHEIHQKLKALAIADPRVQLLQTIPGVGRKTAEVVVAYLDEPHRFRNARQVSCYAGMAPRRYQSGEMDRQGRIHKRGPRQLRSALVEASWLMLRYNPWAKSVYDRLTGGQKTRKKKVIVAVARKLLVRCWVMLLRKEPWHSETMIKQPAVIAVAV
jgi:transposase